MFGKFFAKIFRGTSSRRSVSTSKKVARRIAIEPLESRRLLAATGSISGFALLPSGAGFSGLTVQLSPQGSTSDVFGVTQTVADGSYSFTDLAAGTYQMQILPSSKIAVGTEDLQATLTASQIAPPTTISRSLAAQTNEISLRMFLTSTGPLTQYLATLHTKPTVETGGSTSYATSYTTGGSGVAIAPNATITAPDSPTLTSMSVTIQNPQDGSSEKLSDVTTGTTLTSNYADGVLTVSGVADVSTYQTVLDSVLYSDIASPANAGNRTLSITVDDGTASSAAATSTVNVIQGAQAVPTVTGISPSSATANGGTVVTITGTGFTSASTVEFGTTAATGVTYTSSTQITATAPAGTGIEDVTVTTSGGTSTTSTADEFSYVPSVTGVSPSSGPASGGTLVTITGSGFSSASTVEFGTTAATSVTFVSATQITATAPAETVGAVDVTVTTSGSTSTTSSSDQFTYVPSVTGISPSSGPASGGTLVTITGSGFSSRVDRRVWNDRRDKRYVCLGNADHGDRTGGDCRRCGCHRDHLRQHLDDVEQRPVHLRAERDGHQSEFGAGQRRHVCHDHGIGLQQRIDRRIRDDRRDGRYRCLGDADHGDRARRSGYRGCHRDHVRRDVGQYPPLTSSAMCRA